MSSPLPARGERSASALLRGSRVSGILSSFGKLDMPPHPDPLPASGDREIAPTLGLVLAGGLARRMGGGDKIMLRIGGATILERVLERLRPQCTQLILNANGDPARFAATGLPVIADSVPDFAGPLAGILAGLDW